MKIKNNSNSIVTTSWDDGHQLDTTLMKLLKKYNVKGTFYIPLNGIELIKEKELRTLSEYFEIGSHTLNHKDLTLIPLNEAKKEIIYSKKLLEEIIGNKVQMFCYPKGYYNSQIIDLIKGAGYIGARTTEQYRIEIPKDNFEMWTTIHIHPQSINKHLGNILMYRNFKALKHINCLTLDLVSKSKYFFDYVYNNGGVFHLWGHSYEIEKYNIWDELETILKYISNRNDVIYAPNIEILNF